MTDKTEAVQRMQDYICAHLEEEITLADLACVACFSPFYAHRLFREVTGVSPAEYIRRMRLTEAARSLKGKRSSITDVALSLGFGSVDGFTRAFVRTFGVRPGEYRLRPRPIPLFIPYGVKFRELGREQKPMEATRTVFVQLVNKPKRNVVIKRGVAAKEYFAYCGEVGCDVWGVLQSMDSLCGEPVCLWLPEAYRKSGTSVYVQGVESEDGTEPVVPEGFDVIALPECAYLLFQGEPFADEDYCEAIQAVQSAMDKYDPKLIGYSWFDEQPRIQLEPRGERGYIEMRAVKPL